MHLRGGASYKMDHRFCALARRPKRPIGTGRGFTLVEMLVVTVLMAILAALALPGFRDLIENYRVERMASALAASISHARSEAVRRGRTVSIRKGVACSDKDWSCGWDTLVIDGATTEILQQQGSDSGVVAERSAAGGLSFDATGHASASAGFRFFPAGRPSSPHATVVCVASGGRVLLVKGVEKCPGS